ncbi:MAG: flagellar filament capping protein FliD [Pseudomonadota bacterium]
MFGDIANLIGAGSGINSSQVVEDLVQATRAPRELQLAQKENLNSARISAIASASSALDTFAQALTELLDGQGFAGELVSSDPAIATVSFIDGVRPVGLPARMEVSQLASPQRLVSGASADSAVAVGEGTVTITTGEGAFDVVIDDTNNSLAGLASAINASESGITATVITDNSGARLVLEGEEGLDNGFSVSASGPASLQAFAYSDATPGSMTKVADAANSVITVDGIQMTNSSNDIDGAITGVRLNLLSAEVGTEIIISGDQPTTTVGNLVNEFVDAYNLLRTGLNDATAPGVEGASGGPLAGDIGVRDMVRSLSRLTSTSLTDSGPYQTLADVGVKTNIDGTLEVDQARLSAVLEEDPDAVAKMLEPAVQDDLNPGIAGALQTIRDNLQSDNGSLVTSRERYDAVAESLVTQRERLNDSIERYRTQLSRTFSDMDRQLAVINATQSYLTQQIAVWSNSNNN